MIESPLPVYFCHVLFMVYFHKAALPVKKVQIHRLHQPLLIRNNSIRKIFVIYTYLLKERFKQGILAKRLFWWEKATLLFIGTVVRIMNFRLRFLGRLLESISFISIKNLLK